MSFWIKPQPFFFYSQERVSLLRWTIKEWSKALVISTHQIFFSLKCRNFTWGSSLLPILAFVFLFDEYSNHFHQRRYFFSLLLLPDMSDYWCKIIATWQRLPRSALPQPIPQVLQLNVTRVLLIVPKPCFFPSYLVLSLLAWLSK